MGSKAEGACNNRNREQKISPTASVLQRQGLLRVNDGIRRRYICTDHSRELPGLKDRFYPKQKELMELATNGKLLQEQLGRVDENNANALRSAQQATAKPQNARMQG